MYKYKLFGYPMMFGPQERNNDFVILPLETMQYVVKTQMGSYIVFTERIAASSLKHTDIVSGLKRTTYNKIPFSSVTFTCMLTSLVPAFPKRFSGLFLKDYRIPWNNVFSSWNVRYIQSTSQKHKLFWQYFSSAKFKRSALFHGIRYVWVLFSKFFNTILNCLFPLTTIPI